MLQYIRMSLLSALLVSGCSTTAITSYRDGKGPIAVLGENDIAHGGVVYYAPMLQFDITVTRTLAQCARAPGTKEDRPVSDIRFDYKVKAEPSYIAGERFVLDYEEFSNWSKTGELQLDTYPDGVLKSINSTISDDTMAIVANLVSTGVGAAKITMGVPAIAFAAPSSMNKSEGMVCSQKTMQVLKDLETSAKTISERENELIDVSTRYDHFNRLLKLEIISDSQKVEMAELLSKQEKAEKSLKAAQGVGEAVLAMISTTDQMVWPQRSPKPNDVGRVVDSLGISPSNRNKLLDLFVSAEENPSIKGPWRNELELHESLEIRVALQPLTEGTTAVCRNEATCKVSAGKLLRERAGLFYRSPVPAQLMLCQTGASEDCLIDAAKRKLLGQPVMAPQLGALRFLPLTNGNFQNNSLSASFRSDGTIASVAYTELGSRGKALTGSVASTVESGVKFRDEVEANKAGRRTEKEIKKNALRQDELDLLDHQIVVRKRLDELDKLNISGPIEGNQAASALQMSYAVLAEAERKRLDAEKALAEARASSQSGR